jgi:hypothetical protein
VTAGNAHAKSPYMARDLLAPLADRLTSGAGLEVYNPGDGTLFATVGICDETELAQMIVAADLARPDWARRTAQICYAAGMGWCLGTSKNWRRS